jgi:hypothetical protein
MFWAAVIPASPTPRILWAANGLEDFGPLVEKNLFGICVPLQMAAIVSSSARFSGLLPMSLYSHP